MPVNRRGFLSLLAGAAGAPLVPWRGLSEPTIFLPPRSRVFTWPGGHYWCNLHPAALTQGSLESLLQQIRDSVKYVSIQPAKLIVSPQIKRLIDTDPVVRHAAELALGHKL